MPTLSGSSVGTTLNGWRVQTNVWNPETLVYGQDYTIGVTYNSQNLSNQPQYNWSFPALTQTNYYHVHAYPEIMFGGSPWWGSALPADPLNVFPLKVGDLTNLTMKYNLGMTGDATGHNVAFEFFLTSQPGGGSSTITNEVMVWFHQGAFSPGGSAVGTYSDSNFTGTIYNANNWNAGTGNTPWTYTAFVANADDLSGQIDLTAMIKKLEDMGIVSSNTYMAGLELGAEVATGTGSLTVNSLEYDVQANNGVNTIIGGTTGTANADRFELSGNNETVDGGANIDTVELPGNSSSYTIAQPSTGVFTVTGPAGTDTLRNVEYVQFSDQTKHLLPGTGTAINWSADPSTFMTAIRDFDGNDLGSAGSWKLIGMADVNGDGTQEHILVNRQNGRWAEVATEADGKTYFDNHGWAGDTRVVGIYIDPLVTNGTVVKGSDVDSQRRFQNDLNIDNIHGILGYGDYNHDGLEEVYFSLTDGTAYLHAYMHADGNIQYANYQSEQQVKDYLTNNGWSASTWAGWFPSGQTLPAPGG